MFLDYRVKQQAQSKKESRLKDRRNNTDKSDQQNVQSRNYQLKNISLKDRKIQDLTKIDFSSYQAEILEVKQSH